MKRLISAFSLALLVPTFAFAVGGQHPMSGCGLGYILFGRNNPSASSQSSASTTNASFGNQMFGITSGTSGCTPEGLQASISKETERYVEINYQSLRLEIARGEGEYLTGLVTLLGVKEVNKKAAALLFKKSYVDLFPSENTNFDDFLRHLQQKMIAYPEILA